jgi:hypothetical protein
VYLLTSRAIQAPTCGPLLRNINIGYTDLLNIICVLSNLSTLFSCFITWPAACVNCGLRRSPQCSFPRYCHLNVLLVQMTTSSACYVLAARHQVSWSYKGTCTGIILYTSVVGFWTTQKVKYSKLSYSIYFVSLLRSSFYNEYYTEKNTGSQIHNFFPRFVRKRFNSRMNIDIRLHDQTGLWRRFIL